MRGTQETNTPYCSSVRLLLLIASTGVAIRADCGASGRAAEREAL